MPWKPVPLNQPFVPIIEDVSLSNATLYRINTFRNAAGATVRRFGYQEYLDLGTKKPIDGLFYWEERDWLLIASNGYIFGRSEQGELKKYNGRMSLGGNRVSWAEYDDNRVFLADGGLIHKLQYVGDDDLRDYNLTAYVGSGIIPSEVSHVLSFDTYLIANKLGTGEVHYSPPLAPEPPDWDGEFITAEQSPDDVVAMHMNWDELWFFGGRTVERWYDDGETPFVPFGGGVISTGCSAPHSIQWIRDNFYWLNERREVVRSTGQSFEVLSDAIANILSDCTRVDDAIGDYIAEAGHSFYVLTLPSYKDSGITIVYDIQSNEWQGQWASWNAETALFHRWAVQSALYIPKWNIHIVGDQNGKLHTLSTAYYKEAENALISTWYTGNINHGTDRIKKSNRLRIRLQRGQGDPGVTPILRISWRDNGNKQWGNSHPIELGARGDYDFFVQLNRLGRYRTRQYSFTISDNAPLVIASAEENVEVLNR
jgi:hypothetical protein